MRKGAYPIIIIPARMASSRLPGKPLADIAGQPMIVHVMQRAQAALSGPVLVAAAEEEIAEAVRSAGGKAVLTEPDLPSGSDRIAAALKQADPAGLFDIVINVQGDLPLLDPEHVRAVLRGLAASDADIATLAAPIRNEDELHDPNVVKAIAPLAWEEVAMAEDFVRELPEDHNGPAFHHIGIYAYRRAALERFIALPPSVRERKRRLEQLRALDAGMKIAVVRVNEAPLGVDTPAQLEYVRQRMQREQEGDAQQ